MSERIVVTQGVRYGSCGRLVDVYRPAGPQDGNPTVLLWHGRGPDERDVLAALACSTAALGVTVVVPDWRSDAPDGGWTHLAESVAFTRGHASEYGGATDDVVLAGWSLGALAAAGAVLHPERLDGWLPSAFVGVAGRYTLDKPEMGLPAPAGELAGGARFPVPVELVHGTADDIVSADESRLFRDALERGGRQVTLTETDSDHAGVVMAAYDPARGRCVPARAGAAARAGSVTVGVLARAAGLSVPL